MMSSAFKTETTKKRPGKLLPDARTLANSAVRASLRLLVKPMRRADQQLFITKLVTVLHGMAGKVNLNTLRHETLAANATTTTENVPTVDSFHAGAEPELLFASALGGLVGAFAGHRS